MKIIYNKKKIFFDKRVKPTKFCVRKSVFEVLRNFLKNKVCLDLFSGSGILGFEALTLGASEVIFNDICYKNTKMIKKNIKKNFSELLSRTKIFNSNAFTMIKNIKKVDLIFIDPPYKIYSKSNKFFLFLNCCLSKLNYNGFIYIEYPYKSINIRKYNVIKTKKLGFIEYALLKN
ncbi:RsmD family RNA methyltransferase [Candidatus Vidania fulgoroideorum]